MRWGCPFRWMVVTVMLLAVVPVLSHAGEDEVENVRILNPKSPLIRGDPSDPSCLGLVRVMHTMRTEGGWPMWFFFRSQTSQLGEEAAEINRRNDYFRTRFDSLRNTLKVEQRLYRQISSPSAAQTRSYLRGVDEVRVDSATAMGEWEKTVRRKAVEWQTSLVALVKQMERARLDPDAHIRKEAKERMLIVDQANRLNMLFRDDDAGEPEAVRGGASGPGDFRTMGGDVRVHLPGGATVHCAPASQFTVSDLTIGPGDSFLTRLTIRLAKAAIRFSRDVDRARVQYHIRTSHVALAVRGTEFVVVSDGDRSVVVSVIEGVVEASPSTGGDPIMLRAGQRASFQADGHTLVDMPPQAMAADWSRLLAQSRADTKTSGDWWGVGLAVLVLLVMSSVFVLARRARRP